MQLEYTWRDSTRLPVSRVAKSSHFLRDNLHLTNYHTPASNLFYFLLFLLTVFQVFLCYIYLFVYYNLLPKAKPGALVAEEGNI
jgi:hypothetical protein